MFIINKKNFDPRNQTTHEDLPLVGVSNFKNPLSPPHRKITTSEKILNTK
jgi:hypothetical protein